MGIEKVCSCCGEAFPVEDFGLNVQTPDGLAYYTRAHAAAKQRQFREANPAQVKAARKKYLDRVRAENLAHRKAFGFQS